MVVLVAMLILGALQDDGDCSSPSLRSCEEAAEPCLVDVVETILSAKKGRVGVAFRAHAAIYFLSEDHECSETWRALLAESQQSETPVRVSFRVEGQEITAVTPVAKPSDGKEPVAAAEEKAAQIAAAWFTSLMRGETAVTTSLSDVPFAWDRKMVVESLPELERLYESIVEDKGRRAVVPTEVRVGSVDDGELGQPCTAKNVAVLLMIEREGVVVCVRRGSAYRVVGFRD